MKTEGVHYSNHPCLIAWSRDIAEPAIKTPEISPDKSTEKRAQKQDSDDSGGSGDILQTSMEDPSLRRTSECLRNLQEAEQSRLGKDKSKLADMAKANLSGNGVMSSRRSLFTDGENRNPFLNHG